MKHSVRWIDRGREPQCPPDPSYPLGKDVDASDGAREACRVPLPYPARRCGFYLIECSECGLRAAVTTAGRLDDPRSVILGCKR